MDPGRLVVHPFGSPGHMCDSACRVLPAGDKLSAKRPAPISGGGALAEALSSLQLGAQLHGPAGGAAHPPFRSLGTPRCADECSELSSLALLLGLRQLRALPFLAQLVGHIGR